MTSPVGRPVETPKQAEALAAAWMRAHGYPDAQMTGGSADSGVDVRAASALAQVKLHFKPVGRPALQALYGARGRETDKQLLFFARTAAGYGKPAREYADEHDIALLTYDLHGSVTATNGAARRLLAADSAAGDRPIASYAPPEKPSSSPWSGCLLLLAILSTVTVATTLIWAGVTTAETGWNWGISWVLIVSGGFWLFVAILSWAAWAEHRKRRT